MIFTRQSPMSRQICFINQKVCSTKNVNWSLSSVGVLWETASKQQRAAFTCSSPPLSPFFVLPAASPRLRSVLLQHCSQDLALLLSTPECFMFSQDHSQWQHNRLRSYREGMGQYFYHPNCLLQQKTEISVILPLSMR